jgi:hypothetical protein
VADLELAERLAELGKHAGHPDHERRAVVGHEIERSATQLEAVTDPDEERRGGLAGLDAQTEHVIGVVVDQPDEIGLEIASRPSWMKNGPLRSMCQSEFGLVRS